MNKKQLLIGVAEYIQAHPERSKHKPFGAIKIRERYVLLPHLPLQFRFGFAEDDQTYKYQELSRSEQALMQYFRDANMRQIKYQLDHIAKHDALLVAPSVNGSWCIANHTGKGVIALTDAERAILLDAYKWLHDYQSRKIDRYLADKGTTGITLWQYWRDV